MSISDRLIKFFKALFKVLTLSCLLLAFRAAAEEQFDISLTLRVPRVYDNTESLGYRRYQTQSIKGTVTVKDDGTTEMSLTNRTHKISKACVTYDVIVDSALWHAVGSNKTGVFKTPSVFFSIEAVPSYITAYKPTDDETLVLSLSGYGSSLKYIHGYAAGTLGCGCAWYGHTSPTRSLIDGSVVDRAATWGSFTLKRRSK